jgi:diguanylate cyclase (GGDEF)-like protein
MSSALPFPLAAQRQSAQWRDIALMGCAIAAMAYVTLWTSRYFGGMPTIWAANGILLAMLLTAPVKSWLPYVLAATAAIAAAAIAAGYNAADCLRLPFVTLLEVVAAALLLQRYIGASHDLSTRRVLWRFALIAGVAVPLFAVCVNIILLRLSGMPAGWVRFAASYMAHALGMITLTPLVAGLRRGQIRRMFAEHGAAWPALMLAAVIVADGLVFGQSRFPFLFLVYPPLVLAVVVVGSMGGQLGLLLTAAIAFSLTLLGHGPVTLIKSPELGLRIIILQLFLFVAVALVLVLSAILEERNRAQQELKKATERLAGLATTDGLTGLANRRALDAALEDECRRANREMTPLSLLLLDVDHFKNYNDHYGHVMGDDCLRQVAAAVGKYARRPGDLAARYGGEEFAVLLPQEPGAAADARANALRADIQALAVAHQGTSSGCGFVTVSIGVATLDPAEEPAEPGLLIQRADELLYEAKRAGRNRVMSLPYLHANAGAPVPADEEQRLMVVESLPAVLPRSLAENLNNIARLAAMIVGTPIGLVSIVGRDKQTFFGRYGLDATDTGRDVSFCAYTLTSTEPLVVADATTDPRFANNALVTGAPGIRFYAGAPLICDEASAHKGTHLGALCVIDSVPHALMTAEQREVLASLASLAMKCLEL